MKQNKGVFETKKEMRYCQVSFLIVLANEYKAENLFRRQGIPIKPIPKLYSSQENFLNIEYQKIFQK